jgi:hydrophobic/amphiphilic exporter-1 (mainly G- bacteria), HAE1 family
MLKQFINRPVFSAVISIFLVLLGIIAIPLLPITQYPDIAPPAVTVTTRYQGASAEVCAKAVVTPLERAINGVPGMTYMTAVSGNDGMSIIQIYFEVGTDPDLAAVNVQNRVLSVIDELPEEVIRAGVMTEKEVNSMLLYLNITTTNPEEDEGFLYNFADINILKELKRIEGVGFAEIMGLRDYAMRVWLKPDRMAALSISAEEVAEALRNQNLEAAPGKLGESSGMIGADRDFQYVLRYSGKFSLEEDYENIILRATPDGDFLRLKDIADIEFGSQDYHILSRENGLPSAAIMIKQRPGSNASQVIANIKEKMEELKGSTFPDGLDYTFSYDVSRFLEASINEVLKTLLEAFLLVSLVVFLFLQDWRSTLIPLLAVPVSLIGTLFFMFILGFSINLLTLFALVLAIGIVVDNAIVVVEAVHAKMEHAHLSPRNATFASLDEIGTAVVGITLVMSAVFIPVAFIPGPAGVFYRQFSITLAISIVISGINALTLTPALCALILKPIYHDESKNQQNILSRFFNSFNNGYNQLTSKYGRLLVWFLNRRGITSVLLLAFALGTVGLGKVLPTSFIPNEDQGSLYINITTPPGASLERTNKVVEEVELAASTIDAIEGFSSLCGYSLVTEGAGASYGMVMLNLKPWKAREESDREVIRQLLDKVNHIKDAEIQAFPPPAVPGYGNSSGFELRIQDRTGRSDLNELDSISKFFVEKLNERPEILEAFTSFDASFPQYLLEIDPAKAAQKGVHAEMAMHNLQALIGGYYTTNFIRFGNLYKVMIQASPEYRSGTESLRALFVKSIYDEMVPYSAFMTIKRIYGPEQLTRYNMFNASMINGEPGPGYSSGDAISAVEKTAETYLPKGFFYEWSGITRDEISTGSQAIFVFIICLVFVYLILAAQYESFILPLPVILSLPVGIFGAFFLLWILGLQVNIYAQIAMIMLIGLLGKNAILIVEFANLKQKQGLPILNAVVEASVSRLRPILMTSLAIIAGLLPLVLASGAGAVGNNTIGAASVGGLVFGTLFGVFVIPGLYILLRRKPSTNNAMESQSDLTKKQHENE